MHFMSDQGRPGRPRGADRGGPGELSGAATVQLHSLARAEEALTGAIRMVLAAQGGLDRIRRALGQMQDLARQADSEDLEIGARAALHRRFVEQLDLVTRGAGTTEYAGKRLLDGSLATGLTYVVKMDGIWHQRVSLAVPDCRPAALGLCGEIGLSTAGEARQTVAAVRQVAVRVQALRLELGQARDRLAEAVEGLSRPTMLNFIQLHGAAIEHLRRGSAAMRAGRQEATGQELVLVGAILDIIASYSQSIAPGICDNLRLLLSQLKQRASQASSAGELDQLVPVLAELQQTWQQEVQRPLVVSGPNGRRHRITTSAMREHVPGGKEMGMVSSS